MKLYLAAPYSSDDPDPSTRAGIESDRASAADRAAGALMRHGDLVFSPLSHSHSIKLACGLPGDFKFWKACDEWMIGACEAVVVLTNDGWRESKGIAAEIAMARSQGKNVWAIDESGTVGPLVGA